MLAACGRRGVSVCAGTIAMRAGSTAEMHAVLGSPMWKTIGTWA